MFPQILHLYTCNLAVAILLLCVSGDTLAEFPVYHKQRAAIFVNEFELLHDRQHRVLFLHLLGDLALVLIVVKLI